MANEIQQKVKIAEFTVDMGAELEAPLPDQDLCWSAPITTLTTCDRADFTAKIQAGTSPDGSLEIYAVRNGATNPVGTDDITVTDHGTEGTAAIIVTVKGVLGSPVAIINAMDTTDTVHTINFRVFDPGPSLTLFIFNNTGAALNNTGTPHIIHGRGWLPEVQ